MVLFCPLGVAGAIAAIGINRLLNDHRACPLGAIAAEPDRDGLPSCGDHARVAAKVLLGYDLERTARLIQWDACQFVYCDDDEFRLTLKGDESVHVASVRTEFEALVEKAAGQEPGFFDKRRKEVQTKKELAELKEEAHLLTLPRRRRYEEAGSVTLPRAVFSQLQTAKSGHWGISDVGCFATVLSCFLERRTLIRDSAFEERDGEVVLVARGQISKLAFENRVNPNTAYAVSSSGWIDLPASLERLAANGWLDVRELRGGIVEIRLGAAARKLLERGQEKD